MIALDARGVAFSDHSKYHLPSILKIREHWPSLNIANDTLSAIAPGYYYLLASLSFLTGTNETVLRFLNLAISCLAPLTLYLYARSKSINARNSILIVLPFALSSSFIKNSIWIMTDNSALLIIALTLILIFDFSEFNRKGEAIGFLSSLATFFRQTSFWLVVPSLIRLCMLHPHEERPIAKEPPTKHIILFEKVSSCVISLCYSLSPCIIVAILVASWGGTSAPSLGQRLFVTIICSNCLYLI